MFGLLGRSMEDVTRDTIDVSPDDFLVLNRELGPVLASFIFFRRVCHSSSHPREDLRELRKQITQVLLNPGSIVRFRFRELANHGTIGLEGVRVDQGKSPFRKLPSLHARETEVKEERRHIRLADPYFVGQLSDRLVNPFRKPN